MSEDIDKGARWSLDLARELEDSLYGIICVTPGNISAPWLNFEAGALSKSVDESRVTPFLFEVSAAELEGPIVQFQVTVPEHDDVLRLVESINKASASPLDASILRSSFEKWWPDLQGKIDEVRTCSSTGEPAEIKRPLEDMVAELLDLSRAQQKALYSITRRHVRSGTLYDLEGLQRLIEQLTSEGRVYPAELTKCYLEDPPTTEAPRYWIRSLTASLEQTSANSPPISAGSEPEE